MDQDKNRPKNSVVEEKVVEEEGEKVSWSDKMYSPRIYI